MPAMRPRFPPELSDMIIDYLHEDDSSLSQTAMVCRAWLFRSRVHLFKRVVVTRDFLAFAEFLLASPHVGPYIQQLVLQGRRCDFASVSSNREAVVLEPTLLASIILQLPRLRSLQLLEVSFHGAATLPYLPSIKLGELVMMNVGSSVDRTDDLLHVLGLFSDIGNLCISSVTQVVERDDPFLQGTLHIPRALRVASLKLEDVPTSTYLRVLRRTESVRTLHTIDADCVDLEDMEALSELLQQTGPSMEELMVNLAQCFNDFADGEDLDESYSLDTHTICDTLSAGISACTKLSSLDIALSLDTCATSLGTPYDAFNCLSGLIASARTSTVRRIGVELSADDCFAPLLELNVSWQPLRTALNNFSALEKMSFTNGLGTAWCFGEGEKNVIAGSLPELCNRGVLQIGY